MPSEIFRHHISRDEEGLRLDVAISQAYPQFTRSFVRKLIDDGLVLLNGVTEKAGIKVKEGQLLVFEVPLVPTGTEAQDIPLDVIFEDEHLIVINKPVGMVVHPAAGNQQGTLVNALLYHVDDLSGIGGVERPGIVHRLDKDTSGLLVVAKNDRAHLALSNQLSTRTMKRQYLALAHGRFQVSEGVVDAPLGRHPVKRKEMAVVANGRSAVTRFMVLEQFCNYAFLSLRLETGRTHQIRVHMSHIGHPLLGDKVYGRREPFDLTGQMLHSASLSFLHPVSRDTLEFTVEPPESFQQMLAILRERY
jgi:23S rRNA pseudouridine1911/1915/1917 synthase